MRNIKSIIQSYESADKEAAIMQIQELRDQGSYYEEVAPWLSIKTEPLFISNLNDLIHFYLARPEYLPEIRNNYDSLQELWDSTLAVLNLDNSPILVSTQDLSYDLSELKSAIEVMDRLFDQKLELALSKIEMTLLFESGIPSIECYIFTLGNNLVLKEKMPTQNNLTSAFNSFKEQVMIWAAKNITPKTVTFGTIALSVGMSLLGGSQAHAHVADVSDYMGSDKFQDLLHKVQSSVEHLDQSHLPHVQVAVNKFYPDQFGGYGHYQIQVGDCSIEGSYQMLRAGDSPTIINEIAIKASQNAGDAMCSEWANLLKEELSKKITAFLQ